MLDFLDEHGNTRYSTRMFPRKSCAAFAVGLFLTGSAFAHEPTSGKHVNPMGDPAGESKLFFEHLKQPEYVHVLINPLPIHMTGAGVFGLLVALLLRKPRAEVASLVVI